MSQGDDEVMANKRRVGGWGGGGGGGGGDWQTKNKKCKDYSSLCSGASARYRTA